MFALLGCCMRNGSIHPPPNADKAGCAGGDSSTALGESTSKTTLSSGIERVNGSECANDSVCANESGRPQSVRAWDDRIKSFDGAAANPRTLSRTNAFVSGNLADHRLKSFDAASDVLASTIVHSILDERVESFRPRSQSVGSIINNALTVYASAKEAADAELIAAFQNINSAKSHELSAPQQAQSPHASRSKSLQLRGDHILRALRDECHEHHFGVDGICLAVDGCEERRTTSMRGRREATKWTEVEGRRTMRPRRKSIDRGKGK
jgi:hypothetical protein